MKWFKHISDSLDDPFISDLMDQHGPIAYLVFFGTLEVYAREWKPDPGWKLEVSYRYLARKFHQSRSDLIRKCLRTISLMDKWCINEAGPKVTIHIPKFSEMIDEYTRKRVGLNDPKKPKVSGHAPDNVAQDLDLELEVDKEKKMTPTESIAVPAQAPLPATAEPTLLSLPVLGGSKFGVTPSMVEAWKAAYPAVDVLLSLRQMAAWFDANPTKKRKNVKRFATNWLSREQERGGSRRSTGPQAQSNRRQGHDQRPDPYAGI